MNLSVHNKREENESGREARERDLALQEEGIKKLGSKENFGRYQKSLEDVKATFLNQEATKKSEIQRLARELKDLGWKPVNSISERLYEDLRGFASKSYIRQCLAPEYKQEAKDTHEARTSAASSANDGKKVLQVPSISASGQLENAESITSNNSDLDIPIDHEINGATTTKPEQSDQPLIEGICDSTEIFDNNIQMDIEQANWVLDELIECMKKFPYAKKYVLQQNSNELSTVKINMIRPFGSDNQMTS